MSHNILCQSAYLLGFSDTYLLILVISVVAFQALVNMKPSHFSNSFISCAMRIPNMDLGPMSIDVEEAHLKRVKILDN